MEQQNRTKLLAIILFSVVGVMGTFKGLNRFVLDPLEKKDKELAALNLQLQEKEAEELQLARDASTVRDWTLRSLPPKEVDAQRLYKDWITALADMTRFEDLVIEPGRRERKAIGGKSRSRKTQFYAVQVTLRGKTTFDRLSRFLYYFERSALPQRIADLKITSEENEGNPLLKVVMTVEALSFTNAKPRSRLFPETELKKPLDSVSTQIEIASADGFLKKQEKEFPVRIGTQLMTVTKREGRHWSIRPGIDPPPNPDIDSLLNEKAGSRVEKFPVKSQSAKKLADYRREVFGPGKSPFVLPVPPVEYNPRLRGLDNQLVTRGRSLRFQVEAVDLNPDRGQAVYSLSTEAPKGMTIDDRTGVVRWEPTPADPAKTYVASIIVKQGTTEKPMLTGSVRIELRDPNKPPTLDVVSNYQGLLGTEIAFTAKASDPDLGLGKLSFSLAGAPEGARIDSQTGVFSWTPSDDLEPKDYTFDVVVTDSGSPAESDKKSVTISLNENTEKYVKLIAIISEDGERKAWLYDIATKKKHVVAEGGLFQAAGLAGFVYVIGQDFLEFQTGANSYRLSLGKFLTERTELAAPQPKPSASPTKTVGARKPTTN